MTTQIELEKLVACAWAKPSARAFVPSGSSRIRVSPLRASIAFAMSALLVACGTSEEREANRRASEARWGREQTEADYSHAFQACINRVTGAFSSASLSVMKECERQACLSTPGAHRAVPVPCGAQAIEARRAETQGGSVHESAVGSADAPTPLSHTQGAK